MISKRKAFGICGAVLAAAWLLLAPFVWPQTGAIVVAPSVANCTNGLVTGAGVSVSATHACNIFVRPLPNFVGSTAGADGTAQVVVTLAVAANTMTQVGDRIRVRCYWIGDTGTPITGTLAVNGVTVGASTDGGGATVQYAEAWLHYRDATHANIMSSNTSGFDTSISAINVAGFNWAAQQNVTIPQNNVANNHIIVTFLAVDLFPKALS